MNNPDRSTRLNAFKQNRDMTDDQKTGMMPLMGRIAPPNFGLNYWEDIKTYILNH
jgi:hypothetical protein